MLSLHSVRILHQELQRWVLNCLLFVGFATLPWRMIWLKILIRSHKILSCNNLTKVVDKSCEFMIRSCQGLVKYGFMKISEPTRYYLIVLYDFTHRFCLHNILCTWHIFLDAVCKIISVYVLLYALSEPETIMTGHWGQETSKNLIVIFEAKNQMLVLSHALYAYIDMVYTFSNRLWVKTYAI